MEQEGSSSLCSCPVSGCGFEGSSSGFYSHFGIFHISLAESFVFDQNFRVNLEPNQRSLILREHGAGTIFVLNHLKNDYGRDVNIVRIASKSSVNGVIGYSLTARNVLAWVTLNSTVESVPAICLPLKKFVIVPNYCTTETDHLPLDVTIYREQ